MDFQIGITEAALADFEEILAYSWANFPSKAEAFGNAILDHIEILRTFPYIGTRVAGRPGVRQLVHTPIPSSTAPTSLPTVSRSFIFGMRHESRPGFDSRVLGIPQSR